MSVFPTQGRDGYYDDNGQWQRTKFCFVSCGDLCTCGPPGGLWIDPNYKSPIPPLCVKCGRPRPCPCEEKK